MEKRVKTHKILIFIFVTALLARLIFLAVFYPAYEGRFLEGDSIDYITIAKNIITGGVYSLNESPPLRPIISYTPGYPIFLIFASSGTLNLLSILIVQNIIAAFIAVLVFLLARKVLKNDTASYVASGLYIFEPGMLFYTNQILTETLFLFFIMLALVSLWRWTEINSYSALISLGAALALTTYIRPSGEYLLLLSAVYISLTLFKKGRFFSKQTLLQILAPIFIFLILLSPWLIRNKQIADHYQVSSFGSYVLASRTLPSYLSWKANISMNDALLLSNKVLGERGIDQKALYEYDFYVDPDINSQVLKIALKDPLGFLGSQTRFLVPYFFGTGWSEIVKIFRGDETNPPYFISRLDSSIFERINLFSILGAGFFGILYIFSLLGIFKIWRRGENRLFLVFVLLIIAYFALSTGELSYSRYRYPVNPLIFILAGGGIVTALNLIRRPATPPTLESSIH